MVYNQLRDFWSIVHDIPLKWFNGWFFGASEILYTYYTECHFFQKKIVVILENNSVSKNVSRKRVPLSLIISAILFMAYSR
jgi:hypothetical protein